MRPTVSCLFLASVFFPAAASAQSSPDVADLQGARAAGGETQLLARGYESRRSTTVGEQRYTFWYNARTKRCLSVSTVDGHYGALIAVPPENCDEAAASESAASSPHSYVPATDPSYADPGSLVLVCYGAGTRPTVQNNSDYRWNSSTHKWEYGNTVSSGSEGFSSDVQIELYGDHGRIQLGPKLVPPIHSGDDHGWWDLNNLVVTPDRITASYRLNGMNKPKLTIDRRSGLLTIKAMTDFSGRCDVGNWGAGQRRF